MNKRIAIWGLAGAAAALMNTGAAMAQRDLVAVSSGDWRSNTAVWKLASAQGGGDPYVVAPDADDNATILGGATVFTDNKTGGGVAAALTLTVNASAIMELRNDAELQLGTSLAVNTSGAFRFYADDGQTRPILRSTGNLAIAGQIQNADPADGDGSAGGEIARTGANTVQFNAGSTVNTASGVLVISAPVLNLGTIDANVSNVTVGGNVLSGSTGLFRASGGNMTFNGDVENDGKIQAQNGGDVTFSGTSTVNAASAGHFMVTGAGSDMVFGHSAGVTITSGAHFQVTAGSMLVNQSLETNGGMQQTAGSITAAAGKTFKTTGAFVAP